MRSIAKRTALAAGVGVLAVAALAAPAIAAATVTPSAERPVPSMSEMHDQMMRNAQMQQAHEQAMQQAPGMARMHELMTADDPAGTNEG